MLYPTELLNSLPFPGILNHELELKVGIPMMLLQVEVRSSKNVDALEDDDDLPGSIERE